MCVEDVKCLVVERHLVDIVVPDGFEFVDWHFHELSDHIDRLLAIRYDNSDRRPGHGQRDRRDR